MYFCIYLKFSLAYFQQFFFLEQGINYVNYLSIITLILANIFFHLAFFLFFKIATHLGIHLQGNSMDQKNKFSVRFKLFVLGKLNAVILSYEKRLVSKSQN